MHFAFPNRPFEIEVTERKPEDQPRASMPVAPFFACLAGALVNMAGMTVSAYTLVIAPALGFSAATATTSLAISEPFALLGPLASHRLGERVGILPPILVGLAVLAVNVFLLVNAPNVQLYTLSLIVSGITFAFYIPYAMAFVGRLEPSGRLVGALPGLITIGASIGPALGGTVIQRHSFQTLAPAAAALYGLAVILFVVAGRLIPKESAT
jgi:MFS transporter, DHA1 family, inner membrane transport protein